jgi:hypothetical protein
MLEHPSLLLLPWAATPPLQRAAAPVPRRCILDPDTGQTLGFAVKRSARLPWGFRWLARHAMEVHETEDEPLLFTLYGPWFTVRAWEVFDADEHLVGSLRGNTVRDRFGRTLAAVLPIPNGSFLFQAPEGFELGSLRPESTGNRMAFTEELIGEPFARMLLLAGALALTY